MPTTLLEKLANQVPSLKRRFVRKQADIAVQIREVLEEKQWTQRDLASAANLKESYISKLLHGGANPTLKTICTIEEALDTEILIAPGGGALGLG